MFVGRQMLERMWDGFWTHTEQDWNVGKPCYRHLADKIPHHVPAKRAEGGTKCRLRPDSVRGPVVTRNFQHRELDSLGGSALCPNPVRRGASSADGKHPAPCPAIGPARVGRRSLSAGTARKG